MKKAIRFVKYVGAILGFCFAAYGAWTAYQNLRDSRNKTYRSIEDISASLTSPYENDSLKKIMVFSFLNTGVVPLTVKHTTFKVLDQKTLSDKCYAAIKFRSFPDKDKKPQTMQIYQKKATWDAIGISTVPLDLPSECADMQKGFTILITFTGNDANGTPFSINTTATVR
jgi:hypothetical protein